MKKFEPINLLSIRLFQLIFITVIKIALSPDAML